MIFAVQDNVVEMGRIQKIFETLEILPKSFAKDIEPSFGALESFGILFSLSRASLGSKNIFEKYLRSVFWSKMSISLFVEFSAYPKTTFFGVR